MMKKQIFMQKIEYWKERSGEKIAKNAVFCLTSRKTLIEKLVFEGV